MKDQIHLAGTALFVVPERSAHHFHPLASLHVELSTQFGPMRLPPKQERARLGNASLNLIVRTNLHRQVRNCALYLCQYGSGAVTTFIQGSSVILARRLSRSQRHCGTTSLFGPKRQKRMKSWLLNTCLLGGLCSISKIGFHLPLAVSSPPERARIPY